MNEYERAIAAVIERDEQLDAGSVVAIREFDGVSGCPTCEYGRGAVIEYQTGDKRFHHFELENPAQFVQACVEAMAANH